MGGETSAREVKRDVTTVFQPRPLPQDLAVAVRARLDPAHRRRPFSTADPRDTVKRVTDLLTDLPVTLTVCRGGLDLRGVEVDHVWIALGRTDEAMAPEGLTAAAVLDAAFPLFEARFVDALRRFVVGEADHEELESIAAAAGVEARVLGEFPAPIRYVGEPVWGQQH